jgi:hypothetical protein
MMVVLFHLHELIQPSAVSLARANLEAAVWQGP